MANKPISKIEKMAWEFAKEKHKEQLRKFVGLPYFDAHVQKVNGILKLYTRDEDILSASLLHDVIEDCYEDPDVGYYEIREIFGMKIANIVMELTSDKNEVELEYSNNKESYLIDKMLNMTDDALTIKLADRLQNISDAFTASENFRNKYFKETSSIIREISKNRNLDKVQKLLANDILSKLNNISSIFKLKRFNEL